jgi:hypothetical protein
MLAAVALGALPLGGCVASVAAGAVGAAARAAKKPVDPNRDLGPAALEACTARAATLGEVHVIDVERRSSGNSIVWGTVTAAGKRQSFECRFDGKIEAFKLREIAKAG